MIVQTVVPQSVNIAFLNTRQFEVLRQYRKTPLSLQCLLKRCARIPSIFLNLAHHLREQRRQLLPLGFVKHRYDSFATPAVLIGRHLLSNTRRDFGTASNE
jgi:hypothetical protein